MSRRFGRVLGMRRYKRMFVVVAEGTVSEYEYFQLLNDKAIVRVKCLRSSGNRPPLEALKHVRKYVSEENLNRTDEAWVIVDRDSWPEEHLAALNEWSNEKENYGFALSNPKFEYWLLLHFEDGDRVSTSAECDRRLTRHLPQYDKHIPKQHFSLERIRAAVERARRRNNPPCTDWPRNSGTTVYLLVRRILEAQDA
jgi:hypothetical protein